MDKKIILHEKNIIKGNNKLSLNPLSKTLEKHPSAKNLFNDDEKNNTNQDLNSFSIPKIFSNNEINVKDRVTKNYSINILNIETKLANKNENFYIKNNNIENLNLKKNERKIQNKNIFEFSNFQKIIDKEITFNITNQKEFNIIEEKLLPYLKVN